MNVGSLYFEHVQLGNSLCEKYSICIGKIRIDLYENYINNRN